MAPPFADPSIDAIGGNGQMYMSHEDVMSFFNNGVDVGSMFSSEYTLPSNSSNGGEDRRRTNFSRHIQKKDGMVISP